MTGNLECTIELGAMMSKTHQFCRLSGIENARNGEFPEAGSVNS